MKQSTVPMLVFAGVCLLVVAVSWVYFPKWQTTPGGLWTLIGITVVGVLAFLKLLLDYLKAYKDVTKPDDPKPDPAPSIKIEEPTGNSQAATGDGSSQRQAGRDYFENVTIQVAPKPEREAHNTIGFIPPASAETYVYRGEIEEKIRVALRAGGASAIVGLNAPGGTGKTELARRITGETETGNYDFKKFLWVDVGDKTVNEMIDAMTRVCGVQAQPTATYEDKKNDIHRFFLDREKMLVVFDDVREKNREGLFDLLPPAPHSALITSRVQQIRGVRDFVLDRMEPAQARQLFENVLGMDAVSVEIEAMFKLAERCKYNPLALEIAARRIRQNQKFEKHPIANYFEKVENHFEQLKMHGSGRWDMSLVFDASYNDLNELDQKYFRWLAAFAPTGFAPKAAAHVWGIEDDGAGEVISRFINLSLVARVRIENQQYDIERYRLHDLIDEYAALKLSLTEEKSQARSSAAQWIVNLFDEHYTDDPSNAPEVALEIDNLKKSAEWALLEKDGEILALLATKPRNWLFNIFRERDSWRNWLEKSLDLGIDESEKEGKQLKANVLQAIGDVQQFRKENDAALDSYNEALKLFRQVGDKLGEANVLQAIGDVQQFRDERDAALDSYNEALKLFRQVGDKLGEANVRKAIGDVQQFRKENDAALDSYNEALKLFRQVGDKLGEANVRKAIGDVQQFRKENDAALDSYNEALKLFRQVGAKLGEANVRKAIGDVQQFRDERDAALDSYNEALKLFRQVGDKLGEANVLQAIGDVQQFRKENDAALDSYNEALKLFRQVGDKLGEANVLQAIGDVQQFRKENDAALDSYNEALKLFRQVGDKLGEANVRKAIGDVQQFRKENDAALDSYNEALKLFRQVGDKLGEANVRKAIGDVQQFRKENDAALDSYNEALKLFRQVGAKLGEANVRKAIGDVQQFRKENDAALDSYNEALKLFRQVGDKLGEANVLQAIGDVQQFRKENDAALDSYNEALKLFRQVGAKLGEANTYLSLGGMKRSAKDLSGARIEFDNALAIYKQIGDRYSQGRALYRIGDVCMDEKKYKDALSRYEEAKAVWISIGLLDMVESILNPRIEEAKKHL